jgi:hypothetical protein
LIYKESSALYNKLMQLSRRLWVENPIETNPSRLNWSIVFWNSKVLYWPS